MAFRYLNSQPIAPIPAKSSTALLLIGCQLGYRDVSAWGDDASNPNFEQNLGSLVESFRAAIAAKPEGERPVILNVQYRPVWTDHPLHSSREGPYGPSGETKRAIDYLEFVAPRYKNSDGSHCTIFTFDEPSPGTKEELEKRKTNPNPPQDEIIVTSHGHSVFINSPLVEGILVKKGIKTLLIAGMSTDQQVSTAVRMAHNLALVGSWGGRGNMEDTATTDLWTDGEGVYGAPGGRPPTAPGAAGNGDSDGLTVDMPRIILVEDATRAFGKDGIDGQTIHRVHVDSLKDFAEVRSVAQVVAALQ